MDFLKCHVGNMRQKLTPEEAEAVADAEDAEDVMVSSRLHVPAITLPGDTEPTNLHGDVPGSPYSRTSGEFGLLEAAEKAKAEAEKGSSSRTSSSRADDPKPDARGKADDPKADDPKPSAARASSKD